MIWRAITLILTGLTAAFMFIPALAAVIGRFES